jgi:hypothetical protein
LDTNQETKEAYEDIYTSVSRKYLNHLKCVRWLHTNKSNPPIGPESSPPTSPTYLPGTEPIASPLGPSTSAALRIDKDAQHTKQSFTTCIYNYCLIDKEVRDFA